MQYASLANRYRPKTLQQIIGQDILVKTLCSAIRCNKIPSVFLLSGPYGTGKTTTARVMAACINCAESESETFPCLKCKSCIATQNFSHPDVTEIDAASNTGVEDVRSIIESSVYAPVLSKFKVYIVDEVHMLSQSAFNALLKTLEEPKDHVKFFFATTELNKVPATIISRCCHFNLKRPNAEEIRERIKYVAECEKIDITSDALFCIAKYAKGSVRDALFILEKAVIFCSSKQVTTAVVEDCLGFVRADQALLITDQIISGACNNALRSFNDLYEKGYDPIEILDRILDVLHKKIKDFVLEEKTKKVEFISRIMSCLINGILEVKGIADYHQAAEILIIRLCYLCDMPSPKSLVKSILADFDSGRDGSSSLQTEKQFSSKAEDCCNLSADSSFATNAIPKDEKQKIWNKASFDDNVKDEKADDLVASLLKEFKGSRVVD